MGSRVSNEGQIVAPQGAVALGAAETVTVPIGRTGKIKLELSPSSINASVANQKGGLIVAEGGQVYMQAAAIPSALASIVHSGSIDTSAAKAGEVHLLADGGHIRVDGQITANSTGRDPQNQPNWSFNVTSHELNNRDIFSKYNSSLTFRARLYNPLTGDFIDVEALEMTTRTVLP
mgnify:CR=1 FL=1